MRLRVDRDAFAEAVAWTARALPTRPAVPVLAGMRLEVSGDGTSLHLSGFDYEVSARASVEVLSEEPGAALVPGRLLAEIVRNLPEGSVRIEADGPKLLVTGGAARFTLVTMPLEDYPSLPGMPDRIGSVPADTLATAVRQVAPAASRDDTLPMLTGAYLDFSGDTLTVVATDRYRIAARELWWRPDDPGLDTAALVPARTLNDVVRGLLSQSNVDIALSAGAAGSGTAPGEGMIGFENGERRTTTRLIDSDFVKYASWFPAEFSARAEVAVAPLIAAVKRVALVADRATPLRLAFAGNEVVLEAGSGEDAQAVETISADYEGDPLRVAFRPDYLMDGLAGVETDTARLNFTEPTKPAVFTEVPAKEDDRPSFRYLVQPLRLS
ncbi:DNA polymerase III subunit beta [Nocardiopsis sp. EMB25]|uniref:DNA polymerase III subunit beta n=1 Tax=Nocardiopsis sp. EMB25 TaxID=2835867 RepID=UPI002284D0FE|nr:DNA polymerase III subunit beta [Nocardiopsis sp. EMB25]MCY9786501.1 DNA polymerase III subunit beta [Nocardiopsis sp. EMB25]